MPKSLLEMIEEYRSNLRGESRPPRLSVMEISAPAPVQLEQPTPAPQPMPLSQPGIMEEVAKGATPMPQPGMAEEPQYLQEGGPAGSNFGLRDIIASPAGSSIGQRLSLIGAGDLKGAASVPGISSSQASDTEFGTKTWIDPQTGKKYKEQTSGGQLRYLDIATQQIENDPDVISRLRLVGTEGSGEAEQGEPPKNIIAKNDLVNMERAIRDAKQALLAGAGDIIYAINKKSITATEYGKVTGAAVAAQGAEATFRALQQLLGDSIIQTFDQNKIDQYFNFAHNVSQFEVIGSKTSGETRLTDEDAKRYLKDILNPDSSPNSILTQLGRFQFRTMYEDARRNAWDKYVNEQARPDQKNEYWFNTHIWDTESDRIESTRNEVIKDFVGNGWTPGADVTNIGDDVGDSGDDSGSDGEDDGWWWETYTGGS